ncbi:MAG: GTP-binding protein TypA [Candidatus Roizmanbacteria bacterium GW2011_GWA2_37_7]|uniref:GTP-binding protein TypA n=1 Tax=Candidatus Roizmanbacteria bacterium GW2011_GWA2_37_7 TaxID=1618481 RepID=A0A0G0KC72_9BACT|nr:MAG: GTP-binding protein TypA [Candidatus Roizmanbacteria bacterium GW2011_GWA2_37_7]
MEDDKTSNSFIVSGRGELHLAMLIESMRREKFELEVSKPQVIYKKKEGVECEPYEELTIDIHKNFMGVVTEEIGKRKGKLINMTTQKNVNLRLVYKISSRNLIGIRSNLMTNTRGTALMNTYLLGYEPLGSLMETIRNGALIATQSGETLSYGLANAQLRGIMFYGQGNKVYEGMVVGVASQERDIEVNVCKGKKLTNNRSSGEGVKIQLEPPTILSLEQYLDLIGDDELLEVTPASLRLRKMHLSQNARRVAKRNN